MLIVMIQHNFPISGQVMERRLWMGKFWKVDIYSGLFSLVHQFSEEILTKIHEIHILMDNHPIKKDEIIMRVRLLRQLISGIILSYEKIYGTTELLDVEEDTYI
ncbi:MAG: hypothetical protein ACFFDT_20855 [Candidatus Hodarchaeota archaeon]